MDGVMVVTTVLCYIQLHKLLLLRRMEFSCGIRCSYGVWYGVGWVVFSAACPSVWADTDRVLFCKLCVVFMCGVFLLKVAAAA